ncbi:radical SAM protein [Candidatus Sumerlaeota bacterium]|nr:radical SAM protein [Candidatus Sumerlaeota bacterium]
MKLTFIHAPEDFYDQNYGTKFIPLWAYYLASYAPEGWETEIIDCRLRDIERCGPADVFAFGGINQDLQSMTRAMERLKARYPEAIFLLGGPITWSFEKEGKLDMLRHFDYVFIMDGEETLPMFLERCEQGRLEELDQIIKAPRRFPMEQARPVRFDLMDHEADEYYGTVIEVSRGCPFLCEFCDIRVMPDNNRTHVKDVGLIVQELDGYYKRGVTKFQFACDNFIGDAQWAERCLDAIIEWKERVGANISLFTWLTINVHKMPPVLRKFRLAGFNILFIGIESVNQNSLMETAKVQNIKTLEEAVMTIQSYGFTIAPGFIFGFDSDDENIFRDTLDFIARTGLIGGDPSFLTALAGTPLFDRMKRSGRLIERESGAIARRKITTNIRYLQPVDFLAEGFMGFVHEFCSADFQRKRMMKHFDVAAGGGCFVPNKDSGYASPGHYLLRQFKDLGYLRMAWERVWFLIRPDRFKAVLQMWLRARKLQRSMPGIMTNFYYCVYSWTNIALKYKGLKRDDFALHTVGDDFDVSHLLEGAMLTEKELQRIREEGVKADVQNRYTQKALTELIRKHPGRKIKFTTSKANPASQQTTPFKTR